jgi:hypothetical protein
MTWIENTIKQVRDFDASRPRSTQSEVGWSEVGGCRTAIGFRLDGAWASDEPDTWAAQRGTALGDYLEAILASPSVRTQVNTVYRGIPGHADLVEAASVTDIKTTNLANSKLWAADHSLLRQKRNQAHGYAAGLVDAGELPEDCTVRLLVVPVDGKYSDWWAYEEPFDRSLADEGAERLEAVRAVMAAGGDLPKDMPYAWCQDWCSFFSLCRETGQPKGEEITDPELVAAVTAYGEAGVRFGEAKKEKDRLATLIRGLRGNANGWRISLGEPGADKPALDEDAIRADYEARGETVPMTMKPGTAPRMTVTRIKTKEPKLKAVETA